MAAQQKISGANMNHQFIEEQDVIERYLLKRLSQEEAEKFEEHYFQCDQCFDALQEKEKLILGVKLAAQKRLMSDSVKKGRIDWKALLELLTRERLIIATAAVFIMLLSLPAYRGIVTVDQLNTRLQQWQQPRANVVTYSLDESRNIQRGISPIVEIPIKSTTDIFLLSFNLPERDSIVSQISAEIIDEKGGVVWHEDNLQESEEYGNFTISCPGGFFEGGNYQLIVFEKDRKSDKPVNEFYFKFTIMKR